MAVWKRSHCQYKCLLTDNNMYKSMSFLIYHQISRIKPMVRDSRHFHDSIPSIVFINTHNIDTIVSHVCTIVMYIYSTVIYMNTLWILQYIIHNCTIHFLTKFIDFFLFYLCTPWGMIVHYMCVPPDIHCNKKLIDILNRNLNIENKDMIEHKRKILI